ncbi:MAG: DUF6531 domain-containing protein, partial [Chloroflexota bacterium]
MFYQGSDQETTYLPVSLLLGEVRDGTTDLSVNSPAGILAFTRYYRQSKQADPQFQFMGLGWTHNHHIVLIPVNGSPRTLLLVTPNGGIANFSETTTDHYPAAPGSTAFIDWNTGTSQYILTSGDHSVYVFDSAGNLLSRTWPNNESWTYSYTSGKLTGISDNYGNQLQFSYISNPGQFNDGKLWRIGDKTASGLSGSTPAGRYVEYGYIVEKLNGAATGIISALLTTVRDVRGNVWTYDWYGQHTGESDTSQKNYLTQQISPLLDTNGDGSAETPTILKSFSYTVSGSIITAITEKNGIQGTAKPLLETALAFQPNGQALTTETIAGKTTLHHFIGETYQGSELPGNNGKYGVRSLDNSLRSAQQTDANGNPTQLAWSDDGKRLNQVTDALNHTTEFAYNSDDTLQSSVDAQGRTTLYTYDDTTNPRQPTRIQVVDVDGHTLLQWQEFTYDNRGRALLEQVLDPKSPSSILQQIQREYYTSGNGYGLLYRTTQKDITGSNDVITTYSYDSAGRVTKTQQSSNFGSCAISFAGPLIIGSSRV